MKRANKLMEKREEDLLRVLKENNLMDFKDNPLCLAFIRPKLVRAILRILIFL